MRPFRTFLFVPGHKPSWVDKAIASGADAIVLDLEDSVPNGMRDEARRLVVESIRRIRREGHRTGLLVRPNALDTGLTGFDLEATVVRGLDAIFPPKVQSPEDVIRLDALLAHFERKNSVEPGSIEMVLPMETASALQRCDEMPKASNRVAAMVGPTSRYADVARAVGFQWTPEGLETLYIRSRVLLACRANGIHPITCLWEDIHDLEGLVRFTKFGRQLGFAGQIILHPSHSQPVNVVYTPTKEEVAFYRGMIEAFEKAHAEGHAAMMYEGIHVDHAHIQTVRELLSLAESLAALDAGRPQQA